MGGGLYARLVLPMPSTSYLRWISQGAKALNEIEQAHAAVGGTGRGRRYATNQVNQAYVVLLASQFQRFCRDLHSECVDRLVAAVALPALRAVMRAEFTWGRKLDRGNAQSGSIGEDFGRLGIDFWTEVRGYNSRSAAWQALLDDLNAWRNAVAHQDFDPARLRGATALRLAQVRRWRATCRGLARGFDEVMRRHLLTLTGVSPW
jgi:hypothetical protein